MANWSEILNEVNASDPGPIKDLDGIRLKYLKQLAALTGRNVIAYYSGWLQKLGIKSPYFAITDAVMPGFMTAVNKLDKSKGLDLILHTPGADAEKATLDGLQTRRREILHLNALLRAYPKNEFKIPAAQTARRRGVSGWLPNILLQTRKFRNHNYYKDNVGQMLKIRKSPL